MSVLADVHAAAPHVETFQITGGWGKTSLIPSDRASDTENARREGLLDELRDFIAFHSGGSAVVVTYHDIEDRFADMHGVHVGHFNAISGLDTFGNVRSLFVIGRPLPQPVVHRRLAMALTGRPIQPQDPHLETRGQLMADGTGTPMQVRVYADPDLEALRVAIVDTEVIQAIGRGRAVNRTAATPLVVFVHAGVVVPLPVKRVVRWADVRLDVHQRMAARGFVTDSGTDAWRLYPDLFRSPACAWTATKRGISLTFPYESQFIGECQANTPSSGRYRPLGRGQQTRHMLVAGWRLPAIRQDLEAALGPMALFELADQEGADQAQAAVTEQPAPAPSLVEITAMARTEPSDQALSARRPRA